MGKGDRAPVGLAGLARAPEATEHFAAARVQVAVVVEAGQAIGELEARLGTVGLADRDRAVELDHRRVGQPGELAVQRRDLRPVARLVTWSDAIAACTTYGTVATESQRAVEQRSPFLNLRCVPQRTVLVGQQHQVAVAEPGVPAGVVKQHQRQQPVRLGLVRHQPGQRSPEPERLGREVATGGRGRIALVEDQVDDREHGRQSVRQQVGGRHAEGDSGGLDLPLGPDEALRHRRLADQERAGDLRGCQSPERPQRQRDLRIGRECGMAAGEEELQPLVREYGRLVHGVLG